MKNTTSKVIIKELSCQLFVARCRLKMQQQNEEERIDAIKRISEDNERAAVTAAEMTTCDAIATTLYDAADEIRRISPETAQMLEDKADTEIEKKKKIFEDFLKKI